MKKLGSVEKIDDFILAIAGGADVNGTWKGNKLVTHYFTESMRRIAFYPAEHPKSKADINMLKLQAIISSGADVSPLFDSDDYYGYGNLVRLISRRLELLKIILNSEQAKELIENDHIYCNDITELYNCIQTVAEIVEKMDVLNK